MDQLRQRIRIDDRQAALAVVADDDAAVAVQVQAGSVVARGRGAHHGHGGGVDRGERVAPAVCHIERALVVAEAIALGLFAGAAQHRREQRLPRPHLGHGVREQVHAVGRLAVARQREQVALEAAAADGALGRGVGLRLVEHEQRRLLFAQRIEPVVRVDLQAVDAVEGRQVYRPDQFGRTNVDLEDRVAARAGDARMLHAVVADIGKAVRRVGDELVRVVGQRHRRDALAAGEVVGAETVAALLHQQQGFSGHGFWIPVVFKTMR